MARTGEEGGGSGGGGADFVVASGGAYTDIQSALDAVASGGGTIYVAAGTYTVTSTLLIKQSRTKLVLSDGATVQCNGANVTTLIKPNSSAVNLCEVIGGKWLQTSVTAQGICFDFSDSSNNRLAPTRIEAFGTAFQFVDTADLTFYNLIERTQVFDCNTGFNIGGTLANNNTVIAVRVRCKAGGAGTGAALVAARGWTFVGVDFEPATSTGLTGISLDATSRENVFNNCWIENNATGVSIAAGASRNTFLGCTITGSSVADISDSGTDTAFINTNKNGATVGSVNKFLFNHFATVANGTTVETDLYSDTIPANIFTANGTSLYATYAGTILGHATATRQIKIYFGGTVIYDSTAVNFASSSDWKIRVDIIRETSSAVRCSVSMSTTAASAYPGNVYLRVTGLTLSGTNILKITGQAAAAGAASGDINARMGYVETNKYA